MKNIMNSEKAIDVVLWCLAIIQILVAIFSGFNLTEQMGLGDGLNWLMQIGIIFTFYHGIKRYGVKDFFVFLGIVLFIAFFYENLSIATGFPFGDYYYAKTMETFKILYVPVNVNFAYFQMCYIVTVLTDIIMDNYSLKPEGPYVILKPIISAFMIVMWDLMFDPFCSTMTGNWIWNKGGAYFGVPLSNFYGWFLCVFTMMLLFSIYMSRFSKTTRIDENADFHNMSYWIRFVIFYLSWATCFVLKGMNAPIDDTVTALNGHIYYIYDILQACSLVGIFTSGFVGVLVIIRLYFKIKNRSVNSMN